MEYHKNNIYNSRYGNTDLPDYGLECYTNSDINRDERYPYGHFYRVEYDKNCYNNDYYGDSDFYHQCVEHDKKHGINCC